MNDELKRVAAQAVADILRDACAGSKGAPDAAALTQAAEAAASALAAAFAKFS